MVISVPDGNVVFRCEPKYQVEPSIVLGVPWAPATQAQPPLVVSFAPKVWVATERNRVVAINVVKADLVLILLFILQAKLLETQTQVVVKKVFIRKEIRSRKTSDSPPNPLASDWCSNPFHPVSKMDL